MFDKRKPAYSLEELREMLWYFPNTGQFRWKVQRGSTPANTPAGTWNHKVKYITLMRHQFKAAELAYYLTTGYWCEVRHKDGNTTNNRWKNLEPVNLIKHPSPVKHHLVCYHTENGWEIASDLPKQFVERLQGELDTMYPEIVQEASEGV